MEKRHLLIVDDSVTQMALFSRNFRGVGYEVSQAFDGIEALQQIPQIWPDLILIDNQMPKLTGMDVIAWIRKKGLDIPVILMTGHNSDEIHTQCLKIGSDDYLQLPVTFEVMLAHVEARLKKCTSLSNTTEKIRFADIEVNTRSHTVSRGSSLLDLTATEYRLLVLFLKHPLYVLTRDQIIEKAWGYDFEGETHIVDTYVKTLRKKLEACGGPRLIHTVHSVGYVLREL
ncbi:MAG TPA: response regulator transcription factor [Ktedonobacteraceae bacterium]